MINGPCFQSWIDEYAKYSVPGNPVKQIPTAFCSDYEETRIILANHDEFVHVMNEVWKDDARAKKNESGKASIHDFSEGLADIMTVMTIKYKDMMNKHQIGWNKCSTTDDLSKCCLSTHDMFWKEVAAKDHLLMMDPKIIADIDRNVSAKSTSDVLQPDSMHEESLEEEIERSMYSLYQ
jgi:hypothetical protein